MKIAFRSPLPPTRTGVAHYASMVLPALRQHVDVVDDAETVIYQLGNNPYHEAMYAEAMKRPGIVVLHDLVLHHLIVEMTIARGDVEGYVDALRASHGEAGAAWARARAIGLNHELGNFLMPASIDLARRSRAVIVHNEWAAARLLSFGVETPVYVVPHPYVHDESTARVEVPEGRIVGLFGFLTSAKRADVVLAAFVRARQRDASLVLLVVGEPAPNIDVEKMRGEGVVFTGYVPDEAFASYYSAADRLVNLRYPSAGETSGTLIRALDAGKPVAVSNYAQFAELPDELVTKIPFGDEEVNLLTEFLLRDFDRPRLAAAQREWLESHSTLDHTLAGYLGVLRGDAQPFRAPAATRTLPVMPRVTIVERGAGSVTLRNDGDFTIRTRTYGQPGYRIVAGDHWLELPSDLAPGEEVRIEVPDGPLLQALQSVPEVVFAPL